MATSPEEVLGPALLGGNNLPEGWANATLDTLCKEITDGTHKTPNYTEKGIPFISTANISPFKKGFDFTEYKRYISPNEHDELTKRCKPEQGDILLSKCGTVGKVKEVDVDYPFSIFVGLALLKTYPGIFAHRFLEYVLNTREITEQFIANSPGSTRQTLAIKGIRPVRIPIPPLAEQKRIVVELEELLNQVNTIKERLNRVSLIMKHFRQAVLGAACSGSLTEGWRETNPDTENAGRLFKLIKSKGFDTDKLLPELPTGWKWVVIDDLASDQPRSIQSGPFGSNLLHSEFQSIGVLAIGIDNVLNGHFSIGKGHRINQKKYAELRKYQARPMDVLITVMATIGRCCVIPENIEPAIITKHVYRITVNHDIIEPHYLMRAFQGSLIVQQQISDRTRGQTRPGINGAILKRIAIPTPPVLEQLEIVHRVEALFALADAIEKRIEAAKLRADKLTQSILAKAFRGELVPTEAELARQEGRPYEPAEVLLERVKAERKKKLGGPRQVSRR